MREIGVVTALPGEAKTWSAPGVSGRVRVAVSGIGAPRAARAAERLLAEGAAALVNWGVAGGLSEALQPGDLVLAERIDDDTGAQSVTSAWSRALSAAFLEAGLGVRTGRLWSHAGVVASMQEKQRLAAQGYDIVDMEAAAVARVATAAGVPFVVVKAACDPAFRTLPPSAARLLKADGRLRMMVLARTLLRGPDAWRDLHGMRRDFDAACAGLRRAAPVVAATWPA